MAFEYRIVSTRRVSFKAAAGEAAVAQPSLSYQRAADKWSLIDDLLGGTMVMRERGELWLPREPKEKVQAYRNRILRSFLYNALRDTIEKLVAKPFSRPVNASETGNEQLDAIADNADRAGQNLTQVGRTVFEHLIAFGRAHILVDYPETSVTAKGGDAEGSEEGEPPSLQEERDEDIRPYFRAIDPHDLIGWQADIVNGVEQLKQIRIRELRTEADGEFGEKEVEYIRVIWSDGRWQLWQATVDKKKAKKTWSVSSEGQHTYPGIPLVTVYAKKKAFMASDPPLEDLAELNLVHWQSGSDQRNALRFARIGMLSMTGISQDEMDKETTIAPSTVLKSVNADATFGYVEPTGKAIELGAADLSHIEEQMEVLGLQPLVARTQDDTATGKAMDEAKTETSIQTWIRALEQALVEAYRIAATWVDFELPEDFGVDIFSDFGITIRDAADLDFLFKMRAAGMIQHETFLREVKRRGVLADSVDVEKEVAAAEEEGPPLTTPLKPTEDPDDPAFVDPADKLPPDDGKKPPFGDKDA